VTAIKSSAYYQKLPPDFLLFSSRVQEENSRRKTPQPPGRIPSFVWIFKLEASEKMPYARRVQRFV
jgi:hypothetical protein